MKKTVSVILMIVLIGILACGCSKDGKSADAGSADIVGELQLDIEKGRFGFIDETGKVVIDYIYSYAEPFSEELAVVEVDSKYGFINERGEMCIPAKYDVAYSFSDGLALVSEHDVNGFIYITKDGEAAFDEIYYDANPFSDGMAMVANTRGDGEIGFINTKGELVVPCIYDYATDFSEGLAWVQKDDVRHYIDKTGEVALDAGDYHGKPFKEGLSAVAKDGGHEGWGFIDKSGNEVIPCVYQYTESFSEGLAVVEYQGEAVFDDYRGYINTDGELLFGGYEYAYPFHNGYAIVEVGDFDNSKYGIIDKNNNEVVPLEYEGISYVTHDEKTGVVVYRISEGDISHYAAINSKGLRNFS